MFLESIVTLVGQIKQICTDFKSVNIRKISVICVLFQIYAFAQISNVSAQSSNNYINYADSLSASGNSEGAIKIYKRIFFFDKENRENEINLKIANCYIKLQNYESAISLLDSILIKSSDKSIVIDALKKKTSCLIMASYIPQALIILLSSDSVYFDSHELCFYKALCYFKNEDIKLAEKYFLKSAENKETKIMLENIFENKSNLFSPSPVKAKILSALVPGSGQAYCGDMKNSLNALFLNVALGYLTYKTAVAYSIFDSAISVFPWFMRYYKGNVKKAGEIADRKRNTKRHEILNEIIYIIASEKN
ncbi:MAG: hypothetical protein A2046_16030 [Bacteroidetes bacterium GWA2_30_7]|nr:MAG: hypothetical protein A2046_16030 [Bacteroidetes bacterium GWA2_30_7]